MEPKREIRVGIFGLNRGASFINIIKMNGGRIVAVCDSDEGRVARALEKIDDPECRAVSSFDELMESGVEAVLLANHFPEHAPYAIKCLERGIHVLSECISNGTLAEGVELVRAAEKSDAIYMLAENYPYMLFNQEMKRVYETGNIGKVMYAEGEYNHPVAPTDEKFILKYRPYEEHWRNYLPASYYITHSLAPLMHITGAMPCRVTAFPVCRPDSPRTNGSKVGDLTAIITCLNDDGSVYRVTGCAKYGAHGNSYRICGTKGQVENLRGMGGQIMLRYNSWEVPEGEEEKRLYAPSWDPLLEEKIKECGHGGGDFYVIYKFFEAIREGSRPDFDVYFATRAASVGILAHRSLIEGGMPYDIPDFRREEDRVRYENDRLSPFIGADGAAPTIQCSSKADYEPGAESLERYRKIIKRK